MGQFHHGTLNELSHITLLIPIMSSGTTMGQDTVSTPHPQIFEHLLAGTLSTKMAGFKKQF